MAMQACLLLSSLLCSTVVDRARLGSSSIMAFAGAITEAPRYWPRSKLLACCWMCAAVKRWCCYFPYVRLVRIASMQHCSNTMAHRCGAFHPSTITHRCFGDTHEGHRCFRCAFAMWWHLFIRDRISAFCMPPCLITSSGQSMLWIGQRMVNVSRTRTCLTSTGLRCDIVTLYNTIHVRF